MTRAADGLIVEIPSSRPAARQPERSRQAPTHDVTSGANHK
jgi:hypothetical protein